MINKYFVKWTICSICQKPIYRNKIKHSYCKHPFHSKCLKLWHKHNPTCPICRQPKKRFFLSNRPYRQSHHDILISPSQPFYISRQPNIPASRI